MTLSGSGMPVGYTGMEAASRRVRVPLVRFASNVEISMWLKVLAKGGNCNRCYFFVLRESPPIRRGSAGLFPWPRKQRLERFALIGSSDPRQRMLSDRDAVWHDDMCEERFLEALNSAFDAFKLRLDRK